MYKKITLFAFVISIVGFFMEFYDDYNSKIFYVLSFFNYNISTGEEIFWLKGNVLRLFFNLVLFIGVVVFYFSKGKETRLLRFVFSILFVEQCFFILLRIYGIFMRMKSFVLKDFLISIFALALSVCVIYFLYKSMKYLNKEKVLDYETFVYTESSEIAYFKTNNWQRLLHYIIDTIIFGIIGFQFLAYLVRLEYFNTFFRSIEYQFSQRVIFWALVIIFRTVFYFVFEILFSSTPGKFLTESKVANDEGLKPENALIFKRSLLRSIPLNALSFLFNADWHDNYSETQVYKEQKSGMKGVYYFLIIPIFGVLVLGLNWWDNKKQMDRFNEEAQKSFEEKKWNSLEAIKTIDTSTIFKLKTNDYSVLTRFLKVENVSNTDVELSMLNVQIVNYKPLYLEKLYAQSKDTIKRIKINKGDLQKMVITNFEEWPDYYGDNKRSFVGLNKISQLEGKSIDEVFKLNSPNLIVSEANLDSNGLQVYLQNRGIPAQVTSISFDNKNINWNRNAIPQKFPSGIGSVYLHAEGKDIEGYKMKVVVNDSLNKKFVYEISSTDDPTKVKVRLVN